MNIRELLRNTSQQFSDKTALICKEQEISFTELNAQVLKLAQALKSQGVAKGDKVAMYLPNSVEYVYSYLACFCLGAVGVPLDFMLKEEELISCLSHSETKILIASVRKDVDLDKIADGVASLEKVILCGEVSQELGHVFLSYTRLMDDAKADLLGGCPRTRITLSDNLLDVNIEDSDPSLIMYTSGTTGKPKGILLNYKHLQGSPAAMKHFVDLTDKDVKLAAIPFSHIGGFIYIQNCIHFGITLVIMERFNPFGFLENITKHKVTCFHIVPAMYMAMLSVKQIEKYDLTSLRWVVVFGAPSSPEVLNRFRKYCPNAKLLNGWGMTETCPPNTVTPLDSDNIASIGKPAPNCEIKILDENGKEVEVGQVGELAIRGWIVMDEYYKDPQATAAMKRDGWLYTGDLARFDEKGFLYIMGRIKEMIKVAGQIVYAPEVEAALYKHEGVAEVAVIGMSDDLRGEVVKAFVVIKKDVTLTTDDLRYFAREHLANFKVPHTIELRNELPKNRAGKIDKELLK